MIVQVTLISNKGNRPVSCLLDAESKEYLLSHQKEVKERGIVKICQKRYWDKRDLINYGYLKVKMREYNEERIKRENDERYARIKKERGWE